MARRPITELQSIMPIDNLLSVIEHGILSHERASSLPHVDISMSEVQQRRANIKVPNGLRLHQYANLYFDARNPMLYRRQNEVNSLCILRIAPGILRLPNAIITDCNAASSFVRFLSPSDIDQLELDRIYADNWNHSDPIEKQRHKVQKCAEVLIPHFVAPKYLRGVFVVSEEVKQALLNLGCQLPIEVNPYIFFQ